MIFPLYGCAVNCFFKLWLKMLLQFLIAAMFCLQSVLYTASDNCVKWSLIFYKVFLSDAYSGMLPRASEPSKRTGL